ncbi:MAG TPA: hypothetical protein VKP78_02515 [bacterium]|nr:hypothetical protein [bacterium]
MDIKRKLSKVSGSWYFLATVLMMYAVLFFVNQQLFLETLQFFYNLLFKIIPIFVAVFILMVLTNYFVTPKFITRHLSDKGFKKWFFIIAGGILSAGPIYMWYPLLADLNKKGLNYGLVACFLYNRAIKIPLIPVAIMYFGWEYVVVLTLVMIFASVIQSGLINRLMGLG